MYYFKLVLIMEAHTLEVMLGITIAILGIGTILTLFIVPIVERIKLCKEQYGKDWRKHF